MSKYYRRVEIDAEGNSVEPVNFVGVHPIKWNKANRNIFGDNTPDVGFVEAEVYEKEFLIWFLTGLHDFGRIENVDVLLYFRFKEGSKKKYTLDELHEYWINEIKNK